MKIPRFLFLAVEHNVSRAYIAAMRSLGLQPEMTILLNTEDVQVPREDIKEPLGRRLFDFAYELRHALWRRDGKTLTSLLKQWMKRRIETGRQNRRVKRRKTLQKIMVQHAQNLGLPVELPRHSVATLCTKYGWPFDIRKLHTINDPPFVEELATRYHDWVALYTAGGILRKPVLSTGVRFVHIHPGVVPFVRGSHCFFWSVLVRGRPGFSCFFMNEGIDTGDVIATREYELVPVTLPAAFCKTLVADDVAASLINDLDPWYRGDVLKSLLQIDSQPDQWQGHPQNPVIGKTYYFPHWRIRNAAVRKLIVSQ